MLFDTRWETFQFLSFSENTPVCELGNEVLVASSDSGFGRIFTFEFSTTLKLQALPFTAATLPVAAVLVTTDAVMGTLTTFAATG